MQAYQITAAEAKARLLAGNRQYTETHSLVCDTAPETLLHFSRNGQHPYAIIVTCSDSRVVPELIFSAGIGDLFVIRVAGNVIDSHQLGSIEYAAEHLGAGLIVVLGHDHCGAVDAALHHEPDGHIKFITDEILRGRIQSVLPECAAQLRCDRAQSGYPEGRGMLRLAGLRRDVSS